ncbi:cytosolic phospholipase A2 gamma-like [Xyrichtys novacula]|uniref:Cytosolic phospholipase A2 gamma-like n=1 Tax=Xyrichtys novacula TaxID=13765 RepID=A0AAV1EI90_XYRNO|nr:cytosolic phospholipase A2 gamma-like [Xyrichtys novacula]
MASLTSPSNCPSCVDLHKKVQELEQRISTLHKIQEAKQFLDKVLLGCAPATTSVDEMDDTAPYGTPSLAKASSPLASATAPTAFPDPGAAPFGFDILSIQDFPPLGESASQAAIEAAKSSSSAHLRLLKEAVMRRRLRRVLHPEASGHPSTPSQPRESAVF